MKLRLEGKHEYNEKESKDIKKYQIKCLKVKI